MRNFLIVGIQRTGSSALGDLVGSHPAVACGWEWTQQTPWHRKLTLAAQGLNGEFGALQEHHRHYMARIIGAETVWLGYRRLFRASHRWLLHPRFSLAAWADRFPAHLAWFRRRPDLHVIHIVRRDNLEWLKSKFVAEKACNFGGSQYPPGITVRIPLGEAIARLQSKEWIDGRLAALQATNPYFQVTYEELLADRHGIAQTVMAFLGCDSARLARREPRVRRQSVGTAADYIVNHEQLAQELGRRGLLHSCVSTSQCDLVHMMK